MVKQIPGTQPSEYKMVGILIGLLLINLVIFIGLIIIYFNGLRNRDDLEKKQSLVANTLTSQGTPEALIEATESPTIVITPSPDTRTLPENWKSWKVIPSVSAKMKSVYLQGIKKGNNPRSFSVVGDCMSEPEVFMGIYDHAQLYRLDDKNQYLSKTIKQFTGSFDRESEAVQNGLSAPSALSPSWANPDDCKSDETPVDCELRIHKPVIVFVNLGTNWTAGAYADRYEKYLNQIMDKIIAFGAVPILSTKADNREGNQSVNMAIVRTTYLYDAPLWNFWSAVQSLSNGGLDASRDNIYLDKEGTELHRLSALQVLDAVWRQLK